MPIVIKKKIELGFLGEEYKDAYMTFQSIPLRDYDKIIEESRKVGEDDRKALEYMKGLILDKFIDGKFPNEKGELENLSKDSLLDFPAEVFTKIMTELSGKTSVNLETP